MLRFRRTIASVILAAGLALLRPSTTRAGEGAECVPPPAAIGGVVETIHGREVRDPFRGLEDREAAGAWIDAHQAAAEAWFSRHEDVGLDRRIDEVTRLPRFHGPRVVLDRTFYVRSDGEREQPVLEVIEGARVRVLLDPNALDPTGKTSLDGWEPSDGGRWLSYLVSKDGTEESVLRVLEVSSGEDVGLAIPDCRWSSVSWVPDESGFYYTRYPSGERYGQRVWFHRTGDDPSKDAKVFGDGRDPTDFPAPLVSEDGTHLAVSVERGWSATDVYVFDRATSKRTVVVEGRASKVWPLRIAGGIVWALTNEGAPRFRLVRIDPAKPEPAAWTDVVPEGAGTIEAAAYAKGAWVLKVLDEDAVARVEVVDAAGGAPRRVAALGAAAVGGVTADRRGTRAAFSFSSLSAPSAIREFDAADPAPAARPLGGVKEGATQGDVVVRRLRATSSDGVAVPFWVAHVRGAEASFPLPTLLTGYGGFAVSEEPAFSALALAWIERGGVYALANLRGGNEFGEAWHRAGMREKKVAVFEDFEAVMRRLVTDGFARPGTLAITGGSNGGLLMGAMMTRCPELFASCVGAVGLYDMVRFHRWPPAELWTDEYGSADDPAQIGYLLAYSPYHRVVPGVRYPAFLGATAEGDTRVSWRHTAKFVAALERAQAGPAPVLFYLERKAGHGQGKNRTDRVRDLSRTLRFLRANLAPP